MATPADASTRQFMIYAPDELVRAVKIAAAKRDITASALVRRILHEWLDTHDDDASHQSTGSGVAVVRSSVG
jgi:hypothetical protein